MSGLLFPHPERQRVERCVRASLDVRKSVEGADAYSRGGRALHIYLNDGSYIVAEADSQKRVEDGYQVGGYLYWAGKAKESFTGVIRDADIRKITADEAVCLIPALVEVKANRIDGHVDLHCQQFRLQQ
jgi:hypothetical protein